MVTIPTYGRYACASVKDGAKPGLLMLVDAEVTDPAHNLFLAEE